MSTIIIIIITPVAMQNELKVRRGRMDVMPTSWPTESLRSEVRSLETLGVWSHSVISEMTKCHLPRL